MRRRSVSRNEAMDQGAQHELLAGVARVEALLRVALRSRLQKAVPPEWLKGRKQEILGFCVQPRTRAEIREHIGSIAGYEIRDFLAEAVQLGLLARWDDANSDHYQTIVHPPRHHDRTQARARLKRTNPR